MKIRLVFSLLIFCVLMLPMNVLAAGNDGGHWISVDPDTSLGGNNGDIYYSSENGTNSWSWNIPVGDQQVDALSSAQHDPQSLSWMFSYTNVFINYSIEPGSDRSDIYERQIFSQLSSSAPWIHDSAGTIGLNPDDHNLDALESDTHDSPPFPNQYEHPFSNHGYDNSYFSVKGSGPLDVGDVFTQNGSGNWPDALNGAPYSLYVDDTNIAAAAYFADLSFNPATEQLEDLIVFDVNVNKDTFTGNDTIFFTLAPGVFDLIGDNIYYYSASGSGGLYHDPQDTRNWDALDVHAPEPVSSILFITGAATLGFRRFLKKKKG